MADNRPIGLFDSGVGGLSVLQEIKSILPNESLFFLADQAHVPYGGKSAKELNNLTERITSFLLKFNIKMLVVACNTASCYSIDYLRRKFRLPVVGVVPAIKPAARLTKKGKITIMATPATSRSRYLKNLVNKFAGQIKVLRLGCGGLEDAVEVLNYQKIDKLLDKYIAKIKNFNSDVVILGCTHYPFLKKDIRNRLGPSVKIIDSGKAIAQRVNFLLEKSDSLSTKKKDDQYFTTLDTLKFSKVASVLLKTKINASKASI